MKFRLECRVDSTMKIPDGVKLIWDDVEIDMLPEEGIFRKITATASLPSGRYGTEVTKIPRGIVINKHGDTAVEANLLNKLKILESALGFACPVQRIRWHSPVETFLPETREEELAVGANHLNIRHHSDDEPKITDFAEDSFFSAIRTAHDCPDLAVPLAFWREGRNALDRFQNIQAFFSFYFILEGLYGAGEYRRDKLLPSWLASDNLQKSVVECVLEGFDRPFRGDHPTIEDLLRSHSRTAKVEDILDLLIIFRGRLHHFLDVNRQVGTPLTDHHYESIALLTAKVTHKTLVREITQRLKPSALQ